MISILSSFFFLFPLLMCDYHWHLLLQILSYFSTSCTLDIMMMMILAPNNNHVLIQQLAIHAASNWRFIRKGLLFSPSAPFFSLPSLSGFSLSSSRFGWNEKREHLLFQMFDSEVRKVREKFTINKSFNDPILQITAYRKCIHQEMCFFGFLIAREEKEKG